MLCSIVKASNAIRRKHRMLKQGKVATEQSMNEVLKPITTPLNKLLRNNAQLRPAPPPPHVKVEVKKEESPPLTEVENDNTSMDDSMNSDEFQDTLDSEPDVYTTKSNKDYNLVDVYMSMLENEDSQLDRTWGVRLLKKGLFIGNTPIKFTNNTIQVAAEEYKKTPGLIELLFKKLPNSSVVTHEDSHNYLKIVRDTHAHRKHYRSNESIRQANDEKFHKYLSQLMKDDAKTGKGLYNLARRNAQFDYVYWDNPNELVERLRLLIASQAAGNNSHTNEINSIIEELREANIIY